MLLENEVLLDAEALINSNEDQIDQIESDLTCTPGGCSGCGYGSN